MKLLVAVVIAAWTLFDSVSGFAWQNEVNVSMCNWGQFRANVIRDTIYLDGGELWWLVGLSDGTYDSPQDDGDSEGIMYTLNLGKPFNQSSNITALFDSLSKTDGMASSNIAPNYVDGVMFANDGEFITYGGLVAETNSSSAPAADVALVYEAYEYGAARSFSSGFATGDLPDNVTRYITNGAGVSAPSENMGYYFSGMRATDWGPIYYGDGSADTLANTLISVNMTVEGDGSWSNGVWSNNTLPEFVPARANAQLAWIPVGENGLLVAIGGVIDPVSLTVVQGLNATQKNASMEVGPTFMETVPIYDIANQSWHMQNTSGDIPPQLTLFCSVVAPAPDRSSYNIYIYGGYNGYDENDPPSDNVYILSVPQMIWTLAYNGTSDHGRSGHTCIRVYPDQMMVLGGIYESSEICLKGGIVEVFNLNNLEFQDSYSPLVWEEYTVPEVVFTRIGGNGNGSATVQAPSSISSLFATEYTKTIQTYYPYTLVTSNVTNTSTSSSVPSGITIHNSRGLPAWVGPVLGVVLGLIVIAAAAIIFLLWRRRANNRRGGAGTSEAQTATTTGIKGFVLRWLSGTAPLDEKGPGMEDIDGATVVSGKTHERHISEAGSVGLVEMEGPGAPVHEMGATDQPPNWNDMRWSQPQVSPPLVSPNIDEMMYQSHFNPALSPTGAVFEAPVATTAPSYVRQPSELSTGDESNISEIGSSDPGRPAHYRQTSDNSVSDANSISRSQDENASEVSSREQNVAVFTSRRDRIHTVHEVDELNALDREIGPLDDSNNGQRRNRNVTELE